jgi:hypothetical protein
MKLWNFATCLTSSASTETGRDVHQNHLLRLAREGAQTTVYHLRDFEAERRYATLVAILLDTEATLTDQILDMPDRMIGSAFAKAKRSYEASFRENSIPVRRTIPNRTSGPLHEGAQP